MAVRRVFPLLIISGIVVAFLILGWGIRDFGSFFVSGPRAAFLAIMPIATACAAGIAQNPLRKGTRTPRAQRLVLASVQLLTWPLLLFLPYADKHGIFVMHADWVRWLGLGSALAGYVIGLVALRTLGKSYSAYVTIQEQHRLVQAGIYSVVRHPLYLGLLLSWPGACLVFRSWLVFAIFAYFLCFAVLRGAQEERVLQEHFTTEFEGYRQRTWRLVPFIY